MHVLAHSKALYSTWLYFDTLKLLIDAGEGLNTWLEGRLLGFRDVALTHGHTDHFTGLQNILVTRLRFVQESGTLEPLRVHYPADEPEIGRYLAYLRGALLDRHRGLAELVPVRPGDRIPLQAVRGLTLVPFAVRHRGGSPCLGYRVLQERWRLKPELEGLPQREISARAAKEGREAIAAPFELPVLVVSGDSRPLPTAEVDGAELLFHEATFVGEKLDKSHSSLEDAIEVWRASGAGKLVLYHFSSRYNARDIRGALEELIPDPEERERVGFVAPGVLFDAHIPVSGL